MRLTQVVVGETRCWPPARCRPRLANACRRPSRAARASRHCRRKELATAQLLRASRRRIPRQRECRRPSPALKRPDSPAELAHPGSERTPARTPGTRRPRSRAAARHHPEGLPCCAGRQAHATISQAYRVMTAASPIAASSPQVRDPIQMLQAIHRPPGGLPADIAAPMMASVLALGWRMPSIRHQREASDGERRPGKRWTWTGLRAETIPGKGQAVCLGPR